MPANHREWFQVYTQKDSLPYGTYCNVHILTFINCIKYLSIKTAIASPSLSLQIAVWLHIWIKMNSLLKTCSCMLNCIFKIWPCFLRVMQWQPNLTILSDVNFSRHSTHLLTLCHCYVEKMQYICIWAPNSCTCAAWTCDSN